MDNKYLTYRGEVKALIALSGTVAFTTVHSEGQKTALYRLDVDKLQMKADPLPSGAVGLAGTADELWYLGTDGRVDVLPGVRGATGMQASGPIVLVPGDRLAYIAEQEVIVLACKTRKPLQKLALPEPGTCLVVDPTGQWLVVGTNKGNVLVFESEDKDHFDVSSTEKLHEGAVTALLFEQQE